MPTPMSVRPTNRESGSCSFRRSARAPSTNTSCARATPAMRWKKSDPYAFMCEEPPRTGAVVWDNGYEWNDIEWQRNCARSMPLMRLVHLRGASGFLAARHRRRQPLAHYREVAHELADYVVEMGFTHVELMPRHGASILGSWATRSPVTSPPPRAMARRRISCISSSTCMPWHRCDPRLGAFALPRISMAWLL